MSTVGPKLESSIEPSQWTRRPFEAEKLASQRQSEEEDTNE